MADDTPLPADEWAGEPLGPRLSDESNPRGVEAATGPASASGPASSETDLLRGQLAESQDRVLRLQAEMENSRRRSQREMSESLRYANLPLLRDLLPILDNIHRAVGAEGTDPVKLTEGVKLVAQQFQTTLDRYECKPIPARHQPFDPHLHQAVMQQPSDQFPPMTVLEEIVPGFQLHDRVVRPSQVIVSAGKPPSE